jgi:hypothetical protein
MCTIYVKSRLRNTAHKPQPLFSSKLIYFNAQDQNPLQFLYQTMGFHAQNYRLRPL